MSVLEFANNNNVLKKFVINDKEKIIRIFDVFKNKINFYKDLEDIVFPFFNQNFNNEINLLDNQFNQLIKEFLIDIEKISNWNTANLEKAIANYIENKKIKFSVFGKPTRLVLINSEKGPSISDILYILGKKDSIERIKNYITRI